MSSHEGKSKYWKMLQDIGLAKTDEEMAEDSAALDKVKQKAKSEWDEGKYLQAAMTAAFEPATRSNETPKEYSERKALEMAEGFGMGAAPLVKGGIQIIKGAPRPKLKSTAELLRDAKKTPFGKTVVSNEETRAIKDALKKKKP